MEELQNNQSTTNVEGNSWKIALLLLCLGILAYGFFYSKNSTSDFAYLIGYNLPLAFFIWVIYYFAFIKRKKGNKIAGLSFLAVYAAMIMSGLIGYSQQKHEAMQAVTEIQKQYSSMIDSSTDSQNMPIRADKNIDTTPKSKGDFGEMERFVKNFMNQMASQRNDYLLELEAIGWNNILDPRRIRVDKGLVESKMIIRRAKEIVAKYQEKTTIILHNARENIQSLNMSPSLKQEALSGFDRGMAKSKSQIDAMWALERKTVIEFENIIDLLSTKNGAWVIEGGQILFNSNSDLNSFNSHIASIQSLANQQQQIQKESTETVNRNFDNLKEIK